MLIYVRLLCPDFKFRTFFWAAAYVECGTAQGPFECIEAHCEAMDVPIERIPSTPVMERPSSAPTEAG